MSDPAFGSPEYFRQEMVGFRRVMGERSFWMDKEKPPAAMKAIGYVYLHSDVGEQERVMFDAALTEFTRRQALVETLALSRRPGGADEGSE